MLEAFIQVISDDIENKYFLVFEPQWPLLCAPIGKNWFPTHRSLRLVLHVINQSISINLFI